MLSYMKKYLFCILAALFFSSCASYERSNRLYTREISPAGLKKDVRYVQKQLECMQPDLYWYISKEELNQKFDSVAESINEPMTANEFYLKIAPVVASVRQGHMSMTLRTPSYPDGEKKKYKGSVNPLNNFQYEYINGRLYLSEIKGKENNKLKRGTEVLEINGIPPAAFFEKYRSTLTSDGYNETLIPGLFARKLNSYLAAEFGFIDSLEFLLYCEDSVFLHTAHRKLKKTKAEKKAEKKKKSSKETLTQKKTPSDKESKFSKADSKEKRKEGLRKQKELDKKKRRYGYSDTSKEFIKEVSWPIPGDSTVAALKIRNFVQGKSKVYEEVFKEFDKKGVDHLVLDLRGNPGGFLSDIYKLSGYLTDSSYYLIQPATVTRRGTFFNLFKGKQKVLKIIGSPFIGTYALVRSFSAKKNEEGAIQMKLKASKQSDPKSKNYTGRLYVLIDGMTFSAASIIAANLKERGNTVFVGEETGGAFNGTVAGVMPVLELPHSKLGFRVGLMTLRPDAQTEEEGYGVKPDVEIIPTAEDIINFTDPEMEWVLEDIRQRRSESESE